MLDRTVALVRSGVVSDMTSARCQKALRVATTRFCLALECGLPALAVAHCHHVHFVFTPGIEQHGHARRVGL
jgi:hypothetical protein